MQIHKETLEEKKRRRGRFFTIFFGSSYPLVFIIGEICNLQNKANGGSALGGKIVNGEYYVISDQKKLVVLSVSKWILNLLLNCVTDLLGLIAGIGFFYFVIRYIYIPFFKDKQKGNSL